ncbi:nucleoside diphosphate kinase-like [Sitodiplosis mosellana]|uniref:nucleoside diphosphate kinase-like n=1 Tax=Sitodiplosis mosellana TaxID=263140 RepID=UPI002443ECC7|nr:nucleoside diphosphate kinase-like [Sitodiplosis mosellana]
MENKFSAILIFLVGYSSAASVRLLSNSLTTDEFQNTVTTYGSFEDRATDTTTSTSTTPEPVINRHERTLILLKPDTVQRKLVGKIIERFESKGFNLVGMKLISATEKMIEEHYSQYKSGAIHDKLIKYITSGPVIAMVWEGANAVQITRKMIGYFRPEFAEPGTIRGDFSLDTTFNIIHGSCSIETANKEINIWFQEHELIDDHDY